MNERMEIPKRSASLGIGVLIVLSAWAVGGIAEPRTIRLSENRSIEQTPADLDAETVLQRAAAEYDKRPSLLYDCDTVVTWPERKFKPGDRTKLRYVCRVIQDSDRVDDTIDVIETVDSNEIPFKKSRQIWDGSRFLLRTKLPSMDHHNAYFSQDKSLRVILLQTELKDSFLDGIGIPGCIGDHYAKVLPGTAKLTLRKQMEEVSGHSCYVVEAICSKGENCTFWIDPAAGYHLRKVVIRYRLVRDPPLPTAAKIVLGTIQNSEFIIDDVILEQVSGIWLPIAGTYEQKWTYLDGRSHHSKRKVHRYNIVWNPDLEVLRAFKMDLPEGARIRNHDDESNDYVWRNGRPEKANHIHAEMVGRQAPSLEVEKWYNSQAGGLDRKGKVILLDFFGVWCRPCMAKIPFIKELHKQYSDRGLIVIGVHTAQSSEKIPEFISRDDIKYTIAVDEHGINAKSFNVFFYPTVVLIDRKGVIKAVNPSEMELKDLLTPLLEQ
jgi:thiol-disulfide isomerase/thioredoxin